MRLQMSTKNLDKTRWIALAAGIVLMSTLSYASTWSLMVNPMIETRGATDKSMAMIFTLATASGMLFSLIGGKLLDKIGSTKVIISAIFSLAVCQFICAWTTTVLPFGIADVIFLTWQGSVVYIAVYANMAKLFPDKKGTAIAISGMGITGGSMIFVPFTQYLIDTLGFGNQFLVTGILFTIMGLTALFFFPKPEEGYVPKGYEPVFDAGEDEGDQDETLNSGFVQKDWKMMIKDPAFYIAFAMPLLVNVAGQILNYQLAWMAQDIVQVSAGKAAWMLSGVFLMGTLGKLFWGTVADKAGRLNILIILAALSCLSMVGLMFIGAGQVVLFTVLIFLGSFASGGNSSTYPALIADLFGSKYYGFNFSICYQAIMLASMVAPWIAVLGRSGDNEGNYAITFGLTAALCFIGFILAIVLRKMKKDNIEVVKKIKKEEAV
ncbi:MFS transporter [Eubacteriales bacterium DFI.9.88]|nr:MFS transporter [Eubacteriales bacterium DFI.9.88]